MVDGHPTLSRLRRPTALKPTPWNLHTIENLKIQAASPICPLPQLPFCDRRLPVGQCGVEAPRGRRAWVLPYRHRRTRNLSPIPALFRIYLHIRCRLRLLPCLARDPHHHSSGSQPHLEAMVEIQRISHSIRSTDPRQSRK